MDEQFTLAEACGLALGVLNSGLAVYPGSAAHDELRKAMAAHDAQTPASTVCPFCESEFVTGEQHDASLARAILREAGSAGWQSIETAPKDGSSVLLWTRDGICEGSWYRTTWRPDCCDTTYDMAAAVLFCQPTHWMPLPPPPAGITAAGAAETQHPASEAASKMIDAELEARGWPANPKNAARAGYMACVKLNGLPIPKAIGLGITAASEGKSK